jgi:hypothetical protein
MDINHLKQQIIKAVEETDNEGLLQVLQEEIAEYTITASDKMGDILGAVDWDELDKQAKESNTPDNSISETQFNKWLEQWK